MQTKPEAMLAEHLQAHPFLQETAELYTELTAAVQAAVVPATLPEAEACAALVQDGVPLLQNKELQATFVKVAAAALPEVLAACQKRELPEAVHKAVADWAIWSDEASRKEVQHFFQLLLQQQDAEVALFAAQAKLPVTVLRLVGWDIVEALVPGELKQAAFWTEHGWQKNYCPVCGRQPVMAQLKKESEANGAERFLSCGGCHTQWHFTRIGCVYCGNKDSEQLPIFIPDDGQVRLDACNKCHSYIKTYVGHGQEQVLLQDWATLHLDVLAEEKGLSKHGNVIVAQE